MIFINKFRSAAVLMALSMFSMAQEGVGINTATPDASAILDINSTSAGVLLPRMTDAQRIAITAPATGLLVYQTNNPEGFWFFDGTTWQPLEGGGDSWGLLGNAGTDPSTNALGTTDTEDLVIRTNNTEAVRINATGQTGIGTPNPQATLHIESTTIDPLSIRDGAQVEGNVLVSNANGDATWSEIPAGAVPNDEDWLFASGNTINDPIYHEGSVTIGVPLATTHTLLVDSGNPDETGVRFGSVEYILTRKDEFIVTTGFTPQITNTIDFGSLANKWTEIWSVDGVMQTSDLREKEQINDLNLGLKEVLELNPVSFQWKEEKRNDFIVPRDKRQTHLGFIAQEIQEIIPEIVTTSAWKEYEENPGILVKEPSSSIGVNYSELIPVLVKSIQEQEEILRTLEEQNKELKKKVKKLK